MPDRHTPKLVAGEKETLLVFLDYLRESIILKVDGLSNEEIRQSSLPSGTSLLGLIKHLTKVEAEWFQFAFAGQTIPVPSENVLPSDTAASVLTAYRDTFRTGNDILSWSDDLDDLCAIGFNSLEQLSLRWVLVHMVEETARHAGHADILREEIDGRTGR